MIPQAGQGIIIRHICKVKQRDRRITQSGIIRIILQRKTVTSSSRSCRRIQRNIQHLKIMSRRIISSMKCCHSRHNCLKDQPASAINYLCRILLSSGKKIMYRMSTAMTTGLHMRKMRMFFLRNYRSQVRYRICIGIGALFHLTILVLAMTMTVRIHIFIW